MLKIIKKNDLILPVSGSRKCTRIRLY